MESSEARFNALFVGNRAALLRYAIRRTADPQDAADVVADTFLVAWRRLEDVPSGAAARLWLFGVARRVLGNWHRTETRRTALSQRLVAELGHLTVSAPEPAESSLVLRALRQLPESDAELLRLLAWEELKPAQIATVLGIPAGTVRVRLHRARRRLASAMTQLETDQKAEEPAPVVKRSSSVGHGMSEPAHAGSGNEETS